MNTGEIRSIILPSSGADILIPNATIAEITNYAQPQPLSDAPPWLLGTILWRGWQVPLISFSVLIELCSSEQTDSARICVTKSLIGNDRMPYFGILAQAFPRLTTISASGLVELPTTSNPIAVAGKVIIEEREVLVPDLDRLGHLIAHAAFGMLPVTRSSS